MKDDELIQVSNETPDSEYITTIPTYVVNKATAIELGVYITLVRLAGSKYRHGVDIAMLAQKLNISTHELTDVLILLVKRKWIDTEVNYNDNTLKYYLHDLWGHQFKDDEHGK
jgi:hypothetical protein